jgi:hypothetical protein
MSQINDALKRAKTVQQIHPPAAAKISLRPIEPARQPTRGPGLILPATLVTVLIAGILSWWMLKRTSHAARVPGSIPTVAAKAPPVSAGSTEPASVPAATPTPAAAVSSPGPAAAIKPAPMLPAKTVEPSVASSAVGAPGRKAGVPADAAAAPAVAKPAPPKLQAITFNPTQPSAIINGKTVYVGDRFREFRVLQIDPDSVTLVSGTRTNVLTMD